MNKCQKKEEQNVNFCLPCLKTKYNLIVNWVDCQDRKYMNFVVEFWQSLEETILLFLLCLQIKIMEKKSFTHVLL
jgi:hypothetical protein